MPPRASASRIRTPPNSRVPATALARSTQLQQMAAPSQQAGHAEDQADPILESETRMPTGRPHTVRPDAELEPEIDPQARLDRYLASGSWSRNRQNDRCYASHDADSEAGT